jgi:hypothetical protein
VRSASRLLTVVVFLLASLAVAGSAQAAIQVVDDDGAGTATDCNAGTATFPTIQAGVTAATAGVDTVKVCPGTYPELVTVDKSLVLNGPQAGIDARTRGGPAGTEAIVNGSGPAGSHTTAFRVTASNVTIDGFTIQENGSDSTFGADVVLNTDTTGQTIENNIMRDGISGLAVGSDQTVIRQNVFASNNRPGSFGGTGVVSHNGLAGPVQNDVTIDSNRFSDNSNAGIGLAATGAGFARSHFTIVNNTFDFNGNALLGSYLSDSQVARNVVTGSLGSQIVLGAAVTNVSIAENVIRDAATNGVRFVDVGTGPADPSTVTMRCNSITGGSAGLRLDSGTHSGTLAAASNWWGDPSGPTIASNPGGTGQPIEDPAGQVAYKPFLVDGSDRDPLAPGFQCSTLSVGDVAAKAEGSGGTTPFEFTVTLDPPAVGPVTVAYATADGTAVAGADYQSTADTLTFAPGERTKTVVVPVIGDTADEPDETLKLRLLSPSGAPLSDGEGIATIQDDDPPPATALPDTRAPVVGLRVVKSRLRKALSKGLAVRLTTDEAGSASIVARVGGKVVGSTKRTTVGAGSKRLVVKFTKSARKGLKRKRRVKMTVRATVADAAGNKGTATAKATLKR